MSECTIRRATIHDGPAIAHVHCAAALEAYEGIFPADAAKPTPATLLPEWAELLTDPFVTAFVAESTAGVVMGSAALAADESVPSGWLLAGLYVHPSRWGRGTGAALHAAVLEAGRANQARHLNLWVLEHNTAGRNVYEHWGWRLVPGPTLPNDDPTILDVLYELKLPRP